VNVQLTSSLGRDVETAIFRVAKEALKNTAVHSKASNAGIEVWEDAQDVYVVIVDDGVGFDVRRTSLASTDRFGIASMRQHVEMNGGRLDIASTPGEGTTLRAHFERKAAA
jgi:signal transduction histidine kinase